MLTCLLFNRSVLSDSLRPVDCSPAGSSVHEFPRQEYWSGLPFPHPGDLPDPRIEPASPALQVDSLPLSHQESLLIYLYQKAIS